MCKKPPTTNTVLHIHGSVDNIGKIVLTPDSYQALYGDQYTQAQHQAALATLQTLLIRNTLIFIGFSFADQTFYNQIKLIDELFKGSGPTHYVLCLDSEKNHIKRLGLPVETICFNTHEDLPQLLQALSVINENTAHISPITHSATTSNTPPHIIPEKLETEKPNLDNNILFIPYRPKGKDVIGREKALIQLREQLINGRQTSIGHAAGFQGMGGVGKTQLAIEYAHRYKQHYPKGVIWLTADQDINPQLIECAKKANWVANTSEDKDSLAIAIHRITSYNDCLIIFDNVETIQDIKPYLPNVTASPHLLLTSRNNITGFATLNLDSLNNDSALTLLCNEAGQNQNQLSKSELDAANKLCHQLGHLPLALEIAGAHIKHRKRYTFANYLQTYEQNFEHATKTVEFDSFTQHEQCLISTLKLSDEIITQHPTLIKVMQILAYSANASMGEALLSFMLYPQKEYQEEPPIDLTNSLDIGLELNLITISNDDNTPPLQPPQASQTGATRTDTTCKPASMVPTISR